MSDLLFVARFSCVFCFVCLFISKFKASSLDQVNYLCSHWDSSACQTLPQSFYWADWDKRQLSSFLQKESRKHNTIKYKITLLFVINAWSEKLSSFGEKMWSLKFWVHSHDQCFRLVIVQFQFVLSHRPPRVTQSWTHSCVDRPMSSWSCRLCTGQI